MEIIRSDRFFRRSVLPNKTALRPKRTPNALPIFTYRLEHKCEVIDLNEDFQHLRLNSKAEYPSGPSVCSWNNGAGKSDHLQMAWQTLAGVTSICAATTNEFSGRAEVALPILPEVGPRKVAHDLKPVASDLSTTQLRKNAVSLHKAERITLFAKDGYKITGIRYSNSGPVRANLIVAGAIGVPQHFYRRFAKFAAASGYSTLTLDYRGIGLSAPPTLRGVKINCLDWAQLDLAAAVDAMSSDSVPLYMVGHSYGGQAFGLLPNHERVARFYTFGTGAGWDGWMRPLERIKVLGRWHIIAPLLTHWNGYWPWSLFRMGEDLPMGVYLQWKQWCRYPHYFLDDPSMQRVVRDFDRVRTPMMAANSIDDCWAPPASRDAFMLGYKNATKQTLDIDPTLFGLKVIGHMGYFRANALPLWECALRWLDTSSAPNLAPSPTNATI